MLKKLKNYIKEKNDKKINKEKELGDAKDKYDRLLAEYNKSNEELKSIKNDLNSTENKLDKAGNDINEKAKYIDELKKNQEKFDHQCAKVIKLENELNKKIMILKI